MRGIEEAADGYDSVEDYAVVVSPFCEFGEVVTCL
jgi:hypothetical protein